jgi:hypothetical protein
MSDTGAFKPASSEKVTTASLPEHISALERVRIEKAAADSGFERVPLWSGSTATLRSVQFPESVNVSWLGGQSFAVSASNPDVLPESRVSRGLAVMGWPALYEVLGKMAAAARTLPDRVANQFSKLTSGLPRSTEAERWVVQRVGQDLFRKSLLDFWQGRCCVTGLAVTELLKASHIRPWAQCETDEQRLDVFNGLLLSPTLDALFDGGWISFSDMGDIHVSPSLSAVNQTTLGFVDSPKLTGLQHEHRPYLAHHRKHIFRY